MGIWVVASSLDTGQPVWFGKHDADIMEGVLASGAIAPAVFPHYARGQWFVDGGLFDNTPVLQVCLPLRSKHTIHMSPDCRHLCRRRRRCVPGRRNASWCCWTRP